MTFVHFDPKHIEPIRQGDKAATVRLEGELPGLSKHDFFWLVSPENPVPSTIIGMARVGSIHYLNADRSWSYLRIPTVPYPDYNSPDELLEALAEYYPHEELSRDTQLVVLEWYDFRSPPGAGEGSP